MFVAKWKGQVIAESKTTRVVEGNHYFPPESVKHEFLKPSSTTTICGWKGVSNYYHVVVGDEENRDAAWYYADPKPEAAQIKGCVAFWKGVTVEGKGEAEAGPSGEGKTC